MIRQIFRQFNRALSLNSHSTSTFTASRLPTGSRKVAGSSAQQLKLLCTVRSSANLNSTSIEETTVAESTLACLPNDSDACERGPEYITPYNTDQEKPRRYALVEALRTHFRLSDKDIDRILKDEVVKRSFHHRTLVCTMEMLCLEGVTKESFLNYPWLITLDRVRLQDKLALIKTIALRDLNHFVPFLRLTLPRLRKIVSIMKREANVVPQGNRVYYISEMLKTDPKLVTKYLSKRLFILEMPFDMLEQNLQHMVNYNVSPQNILKDLWAFRYTPKSVQLRLERAKRAKKDKIMPWMVRCPEPILQRSFKLTLDDLAVLGEKKSVVEYVAERLGFDVESTQCIMARHPSVMRVRVTKVKEVLDYLLNEEGFTRHEIANVPRILCHGLKTTKQRIEELKSYGCRPSSLVIVCRSKREYDKFVRMWLENENQMHRREDKNKTEDAEAV
ncbi:transcription termination factor, mitochondrial [Rhagoletis pomonella]|uniref:transcription termination factor, mitochondrial n=1 Tax=Rhagoletis pomonella TaxID=28610 RepID=UPI00177D353A|nr:transcription termination factor, mitochondrial [Rhagoletis pomonella]